jgi:hypothetical protein
MRKKERRANVFPYNGNKLFALAPVENSTAPLDTRQSGLLDIRSSDKTSSRRSVY